jgi:iron complex outermembrane receptor protein
MRFAHYVSVAALSAAGALVTGNAAFAQDSANPVVIPDVVVSTTPVPGAVGIEANKVPSIQNRVSSDDFGEKANYAPSVTQAITQKVPAAIAINVDGSDLSPDLYYRGFDVSRVSGTAQGLAIYQNGVRINEAFGDSVNLDLIPPIAIDHADIYTNNPIFGLNALGGAINFTMKNGFNFHGGDVTVLGGSYGRVNGFMEYGKESGNYSMYFAADGYRDGGYRPFGAQNAERAYLDLGYRSQDSEIHVIGSYGRSLLGVQGTTPTVLVNQQYNSVFTTPQTTNNQAGLAQLTGRFDIAPHWSVASNFYVRQFDQYHVDGNDADVDDCRPGGRGTAVVACLPSDDSPGTAAQRAFINHGQFIPYLGDAFPYGSTARTATHTTSFGTQQQVTNTDKIFGHDNYFVLGGSVDTSSTNFSSATTLGQLNSAFQNIESGFPGAGVILQTAGQLGYAPVYIHSQATYYGLFALDTFNITKQLALTAGARFNIANIALNDLSGMSPALNTSNSYNRINPVVGLTYEFAPAFTVYGGYSEANRAPTPLESQCSNPAQPCILETALVSDPPLQQVVSHTFEGGARGLYTLPNEYGSLAYKAGYFHTTSTNDIVNEASPISGQGFFTNVPETLRQGVEFGLIYNKGPFSFYGNYAYVDATYQFAGTFASPNNPMADGDGNIFVRPGDHIPGIPRNIGKLGVEYQFTPRFKAGADTILVGSQYYVGDDANQNPQLPFYYVVNAHASYQVTDHVQIFGLVNNLLNRHYATFGTFYGTDTTGGNVNATLAANGASASPNADAITVAQPLSFYGGIKVTF